MKLMLELMLTLLLKELSFVSGKLDSELLNSFNLNEYVLPPTPPSYLKEKEVQKIDCQLPPKPENGDYNVTGDVKPIKKFVTSSTFLIYTCNNNYEIHSNQPSDVFVGVSVCNDNGIWSHQIDCKENNEKTASMKCKLPPKPNHGHYLVNGREMAEGSLVNEYITLAYYCDEDYIVNNTETKHSFCSGGYWEPNLQCVQRCLNLISYTMDLKCMQGNRVINCSEPMNNGTSVTMKCKQYHKQVDGFPLNPIACINGKWTPNFLAHCKAECGHDKSKGKEHVIGGANEDRDSSPWHVGIYKLEKDTHAYKCGGTIINNKVVITAAHCFDTGSGQIAEHTDFRITAGKLYSAWDHNETDRYPYIQKHEISELIIAEKYYGHELSMQSDIAVVVIKEMFKFSESVHAACLSLSSDLLEPGKQGKVVGWGLIEEGNVDSIAYELKKAILPVVDLETCRKGVPAEFHKYTKIADKFCVGYNDKGPTICSGDSGGGFLMFELERDYKTWYLEGVVSSGPKEDTGTTCKKDSYTLFTKITFHSPLINNIIAKFK